MAKYIISDLLTDEQIQEIVDKDVDDLIAKMAAAMKRYGVNDPYDPSLSPQDFHALQKELINLKPRRRKQSKYSAADDSRILKTLLIAESKSGGAARGAEVLFKEMRKEGHKVASAEILRQRYQALKKMMLDQIDRFEKKAGLDRG